MEKIERQIEAKDELQAEKVWQGLVKLRDGLLKEQKSEVDHELFSQAFDEGAWPPLLFGFWGLQESGWCVLTWQGSTPTW